MAGLVENVEKDEEREKDVEPYPVPRRIRTRKPWRLFICLTFAAISAIALFFGLADGLFDRDAGTRASRIETLKVQIEDAKGDVDESASDSGSAHNPKAVCEVVATAQNKTFSMVGVTEEAISVPDKAFSECVSMEIPYVGDDPAALGPWFWPNTTSALAYLSWSFITPLTFEGTESDVAWLLSQDGTPVAIATATYAVGDDGPEIRDLSLTLTSYGESLKGEAPPAFADYLGDAAWVEAARPKKSAISKVLGSEGGSAK